MTSLESDFLDACREAVLRQAEMVPLLADSLDVAPEQVFYHWVVSRCTQKGSLRDADWRYFFHGTECDLENVRDGRFLRIDFGPGGRFDTFTGWGVMQFVLCSRAPWKEFPALRDHLADPKRASTDREAPPPRLSGSHKRMVEISGILEGRVETVPCPSRAGAPPEDPSTLGPGFWDRLVSHRVRLSERGRAPS